MNVILEVTPSSLAPSDAYICSKYDGPGLYHNTASLEWFLVYDAGTTVPCLCITRIGQGLRCPIGTAEAVKEQAPPPPPVATGITMADVLKVIAISQQPSLSTELLK